MRRRSKTKSRAILAIEGNLEEAMAAEIKHSAKAITQGVKEATDRGKKLLRRRTVAAGLGRRLANTWRGQAYPKNKISMSAAGLIKSRAPKLMRGFTQGVTIKSKNGFFLAVPTAQAPKRGTDRKRIHPGNFPESRYGPLRFVYRRTGPSLLVVDGVKINKSGRAGRQLKNKGKTKTGRYKKGVVTVVMFVLVPQVKIRKRLDLKRENKRIQKLLWSRVRSNLNKDQKT